MIKMDIFGIKRIGQLEAKLAEAEGKIAEVSREKRDSEALLEHREGEYKKQEGEYLKKISSYEVDAERPVPSKLHILLVEDKDKHLESVVDVEAAGHKVDVVRDYSHAIARLDIMAKDGTPYDVVLSDMMFPYGSVAGKDTPICSEKTTQEAALGYAVALYASQRGVKAVVIITDMSHHDGPVAATFDDFYAGSIRQTGARVAFNLSGTTVVMYDCRDLESKTEGGYGSKPWINAVKILQENGYGRSSYPLKHDESVTTGGNKK